MWVCKIKIDSDDTAIGNLCKEIGVSASIYPTCSTKKGESIIVNFMLFVFGDREKRDIFLKKLNLHPRILNLESKGHCALGEIKEVSQTSSVYNHNVFHFEPIKCDKEGYEIWTMAAWNKEELMNFISAIESRNGKLLKIRQEDISNLSVLTLHPELTDNQRRAIELAIENKYYDIPRGIQLEELAKMIGVSYSTYQVHLRKAEKKLLPFFFERG